MMNELMAENMNPAYAIPATIASSPVSEPKLTLTVEDLAYHLNISRTTAYNLARQKDFYPAFYLGHRLIINAQALSRWLDEQTGGLN